MHQMRRRWSHERGRRDQNPQPPDRQSGHVELQADATQSLPADGELQLHTGCTERPQLSPDLARLAEAWPKMPVPGLVLTQLREAPDGLTRTELQNAFNRNLPAGKLLTVLDRARRPADRSQDALAAVLAEGVGNGPLAVEAGVLGLGADLPRGEQNRGCRGCLDSLEPGQQAQRQPGQRLPGQRLPRQPRLFAWKCRSLQAQGGGSQTPQGNPIQALKAFLDEEAKYEKARQTDKIAIAMCWGCFTATRRR